MEENFPQATNYSAYQLRPLGTRPPISVFPVVWDVAAVDRVELPLLGSEPSALPLHQTAIL